MAIRYKLTTYSGGTAPAWYRLPFTRGVHPRYLRSLFGFHKTGGQYATQGVSSIASCASPGRLKRGLTIGRKHPERPCFAACRLRMERAEPDLIVVQIPFMEWTPYGKLRHPRLVGIRNDKSHATSFASLSAFQVIGDQACGSPRSDFLARDARGQAQQPPARSVVADGFMGRGARASPPMMHDRSGACSIRSTSRWRCS